MTIDSPELRTLVRTGIAAAFAELRATHPADHIYAYGLYTDDGVAGIVPTANSEESLAALSAKHQARGPKFTASLRWSWWEWTFGGNFGSKVTQPGYRAISELGQDLPDDADFGQFRQAVLSLMPAVLSDLDAEGGFGRGADREAVTLFCSVSDSADTQPLALRTVRELNSPAVAARYEADPHA